MAFTPIAIASYYMAFTPIAIASYYMAFTPIAISYVKLTVFEIIKDSKSLIL